MSIAHSKICSHCGKHLPIESFSKARSYKDGYRGQCKTCRNDLQQAYVLSNPHIREAWKKTPGHERAWRNNLYKQRYGISIGDYEQMLARQGGQCAICCSRPKRLQVDHCHDTGEIRGLLCSKCNVMLAQMGDNLDAVRANAKRLEGYLEKSLSKN